MRRFALLIGFALALSGCARLEKYDPRQEADASGRVVNATTGEPVVARLYYQDNDNQVVVSYADGKFRFPSVRRSYAEIAGLDRKGSRWLVIEAKGYRQALREVLPGQKGDLEIRLEPQP